MKMMDFLQINYHRPPVAPWQIGQAEIVIENPNTIRLKYRKKFSIKIGVVLMIIG
ncbi:MAG: hypothetical protein JWM28_2639 [Chitinophagaceae bacterium]|nr:hypothetical protein [Chitinophagaceae bacterium]